MKKLIIAALMACVALSNVWGQELNLPESAPAPRPKIAVVLAGGGAKGVAHVAALKAIEDAGIPIDLVVGTSIGSIVGGMYCTGYSPDTMRQIISETDWIKLITDNPDFDIRTLTSKKDNEFYQLRFSIDPFHNKSDTRLGGLIQGANVVKFFQSLTWPLPDSLDFEDMPIPFACVGTEAVNGRCKVFTSGNVPMAMRASMAIPSVFTPVSIDSTVYVDGGVCDNFPVDIAREMGADIVIGVDLCVQMSAQQLTNSAIDVLMNCVDLYSAERYKKNVKDADIYIPIDVTGYSAASFGAEALDTLMHRGDYYVSLKKPELDSLAASLNLQEEVTRTRIGEYSFAKSNEGSHSWKNTASESLYEANDGSLNSSINIGGRIDDREYASIIAKMNLVVSQKRASLIQIRGRIGQRLELKTDYSQQFLGQRVGFSWKVQRHDVGFNVNGDKRIDLNMIHNKFNLYFTNEWHKVKYVMGVNYNIFNYKDILAEAEFSPWFDMSRSSKEKFFCYYLDSEFNSLDRQYYPTRGRRVKLSVDLISDNLYQFQHKMMFPIFAGSYERVFSPSSKLTIIPYLKGRIMVSRDRDEPLALMNTVGGLFDEMHFIHQRTFAGTSEMELIANEGYGIAGITLQRNTYKNQYLNITGDIMSHASNFKDALKSESLNWGVEASYGIRTSVGPVFLKCYYSDLVNKFLVSLNAGYYF